MGMYIALGVRIFMLYILKDIMLHFCAHEPWWSLGYWCLHSPTIQYICHWFLSGLIYPWVILLLQGFGYGHPVLEYIVLMNSTLLRVSYLQFLLPSQYSRFLTETDVLVDWWWLLLSMVDPSCLVDHLHCDVNISLGLRWDLSRIIVMYHPYTPF